MTGKLLRPFTPTQQKIAALIARNLSYKEIGRQLGGRRPRTIRGHVESMAMMIDGMDDDLEPRIKVYLYVKHGQWEAELKKQRT